MPLNPTDVANRWAQNLAASSQKISAGVAALTVSPTQQAADAAQTWLARINDPATLIKYQNNLRKVTLQQWKDAFNGKGLQRISSGAQAALQTKVVPFLTAWLPYEDALKQQVKSMPNATLQDRIARAVFAINYNHNWPGR